MESNILYTKYVPRKCNQAWANSELYLGQPISKLNTTEDFPWLDRTSQQAKDLEKFSWFSNGYLALDKNDKNIVYDIRFSPLPNETEGLWGVKLNRNKNSNEHIEYITNRRNDSKDIKI